MARRRANGEGSVTYDRRRSKPYRARVTVGWTTDEKTGKAKQVLKDIGSYKTKGEATRAIAEYQNRPYDLTNKNITFSELYNVWFDDFVKDHESTKYKIKAAYKYCSSLYNKKIREITVHDMKVCINEGTTVETRGENKGKIKAATPTVKEDMKYIFNHLFTFAVEARLVDHNYAREFSLDKKVLQEKENDKKERPIFTDKELKKLWQAIDLIPFADMVLYECYSGWRPSELINLKLCDVHLKEEYIIGGMKTETGKNRVVPIHSAVKDIVKKYYEQAKLIGSDMLFNDPTKKRGIRFSYDHYLEVFENIRSLLELNDKLTPHCCRHTFASMAEKAGMNEHVRKIFLGHKDSDMTERYTHRDFQELKEQMELIKKPEL